MTAPIALRRRGLALAAATALVALAAGCRGEQSPPTPQPPSNIQEHAPPAPEHAAAEKELDSMREQTILERARDAATRRELVAAAPPGFRPKAQGRRLELALIAQKAMLRKGESFWYRAEIKNVGTEPIAITDPFINGGSGGNSWSKFRLEISPSTPGLGIGGDGGEPCMFDHPPVPGWGRMTEDQRKSAAKRWALEETVGMHRINVTLAPGETIRTRDGRLLSSDEMCAGWKAGNPAPDRPGGLFREHDSPRDFARPGSYRVKLVLDDPGLSPSPLVRRALESKGRSKAEIDAYLHDHWTEPPLSATSNEVLIEVVR